MTFISVADATRLVIELLSIKITLENEGPTAHQAACFAQALLELVLKLTANEYDNLSLLLSDINVSVWIYILALLRLGRPIADAVCTRQVQTMIRSKCADFRS